MPLGIDTPRPSFLWKQMSEERRLVAARAFWDDEQSAVERAEVVGLIARQLNFRPKSVLALPAEKKARHLVRIPRVPETVAARLLVGYHLAAQRPMMAAFLDALGIGHENGLITGEKVAVPGREALLGAARALESNHPVEDVRLYFATLLIQDPETWGALRQALDVTPGGGSTAA